MLMLFVLLGIYAASVWLACAYTLPGQALVQGIGLMSVAGVAALTLWLLVRAGYLEAWLAIALVGVIALPASLIGLGLTMGALIRITARKRNWAFVLTRLGASVPIVLGAALLLAR